MIEKMPFEVLITGRFVDNFCVFLAMGIPLPPQEGQTTPLAVDGDFLRLS